MKNTVLVTGVTGSLGRATAFELAKRDCRLIILGRDTGKLSQIRSEIAGTTGNNDVEYFVADLSEPSSVKTAVAGIRRKYTYLNALVNVAAVLKSQKTLNSQGLDYMFATNHLGPFILTNGLLDLLKAGSPARILTVSAPSTSKIDFDSLDGAKENAQAYLSAFGSTKMMNIMFSYALARRLEGSGVTSNVFHPGLLKSDLLKETPGFMYYMFRLISAPPEKAATMLSDLVTDSRFEGSNGLFYKYNGDQIKSNGYSHDVDLQEKLWSISEDLSAHPESEKIESARIDAVL